MEETKVQKREKSLEIKVGWKEEETKLNEIFYQISSFRTTFLSLMTRKTLWRTRRN